MRGTGRAGIGVSKVSIGLIREYMYYSSTAMLYYYCYYSAAMYALRVPQTVGAGLTILCKATIEYFSLLK